MLGKRKAKQSKGFLQSLRSNTTGNVYAMAAAALFPIAGLIGGGVDIGRAYMAQMRLQQACDAGALAGRRSMSGALMSTADAVEARKFFDFNFPEGSFDTAAFAPVDGDPNPRFVDGPGDKTVNGFAETTINTSIMRIFGYEQMTLKVDCTSRLDIGNVDIIMALDVTGSMGGTRIAGLKDAVEDFYDILGTGGGAQGSQIRYGFVPYNALVNTGGLLVNEDPSWVVGGTGVPSEDEWNYQTRRAHWLLPTTPPVETFETINVAGADGNDRRACRNKFGVNVSVPPLWSPGDSGTISTSGNNVTHAGDYYEFSYYSYRRISSSNKVCTRKVEKWVGGAPGPTTSTVWEPGATFDHWEYDEFKHDVSDYVASLDTSNPRALRPTLYSNPSDNTDGPTDRWNGCIEERDTYQNIVATTNAIPDNAYDLDLDLIPENNATRWRPYWEQVEYKRNGNSVSDSSCPAESRLLAEYASYDSQGLDSSGNTITTSTLRSYIDGLSANGYTNHTIGMIWAGRLISAEGLFGTENSVSKNGFNISRHVLFMTDGTLNVNPDRYNVYGYNDLDGRLAPAGTGKTEYSARQAQRFQLICNAVKAKGITVWVVQFGTSTVTSNMENCASTPDHAAAATNNAALSQTFGDIAKTIGGLRLSK